MPKRVQLRRGTTAQHATFTGAVGEVTYDTDLKTLRLHDGVTAGGTLIDPDAFMRLITGDPFGIQSVDSQVIITGGGGGDSGLEVDHGAVIQEFLIVDRFSQSHQTEAYAASIALNFSNTGGGSNLRSVTLAGNLTLTTTGLSVGLQFMLRIVSDGSLRTLTFPAGWKFVGAAAPANIAASKVGILQLRAFGPTDSDVVARWLVEP